MASTYCTRYGSPETRKRVEHEEGECAACVFTGGIREGGIVFVVIEREDGQDVRRIEGLAELGSHRINGCYSVTTTEADAEIASYKEGS